MSRRDALTASRKKKAKKLLSSQQFSEARELYAEICRIDPLDYESWLLLAELSVKLRALGDAEVAYQQAASLRPQELKAPLALGLLYKTHGRFVDAEQWLRRCFELQPVAGSEYKRLGVELQQRGQLDLAIVIYRGVLAAVPDDLDTLNNLGVALQNSGQLDEAQVVFAAALQLQPKAHLYCNMANVMVEMGDLPQAEEAYRQALLLEPQSTYVLGSLGALYMEMMRLDEARALLDQALLIDPGFAGAHWNRAQLLLLQGDFRQGWLEYDARLNSPEVMQRFGARQFSRPQWSGVAAPDKTVLVYAEQGFGDAIQFCRYLPLLQSRVGRVVFECRAELMGLMQIFVPGIELILRREDFGEPAVAFDYQIALMSLPRIFDTVLETIPADLPYLRAEPLLQQQWAERMVEGDLKVGLVWAGSPTHQSDRHRSMRLVDLAPLAQVAGVTFYSLQKGVAAGQAAQPPAGMRLIDLGAEIGDFSDTAAIIANLDLVITVDTAVAHLAGALGRPVWVMLYFPPEWRWLLDRDDSPWYPTMRLFRQDGSRDWAPVVARLQRQLPVFLSG